MTHQKGDIFMRLTKIETVTWLTDILVTYQNETFKCLIESETLM